MARVPWVEQAWGQDELARTHRLVGFTSFNLMLAHIVLITLGYAAATSAGLSAPSSTSSSTTPGCCSPLAGTAALVVVVVTSVKRPAARLRYESWHLIHLYAYLGAGPRPAAPAVDRHGLPAVHDRDRLLVGPVRRVRRRGARVPGRAAAVALVRHAAARARRRAEEAPA